MAHCLTKLEQAGNRPAGRESDGEHFRSHKNRNPHEGDHVLRVDLPCGHTDNPIQDPSRLAKPAGFGNSPLQERSMTSQTHFAQAAVAAPHFAASEAGQAILAQGGNAIEAMVAMAATIAVVYPHMNGIGGDGFWLIREPGGKIHAIEACGPAGAKATLQAYHAKGYDKVPVRGADAAATVAGAIGGWRTALDIAAALGGKIPLGDLLHDAIGRARNGYPVSESESRYPAKLTPDLLAAPNFAATFFPDGKPMAKGALKQMPRLADTLDQLVRAGLDDFYRGDVGREMANELERYGTPIVRADLEKYRTALRKPLEAKLPGVTLYNFPPPTQGLASLLILGIAAQLGLREPGSFGHMHGLVEATKRANAIRDRVVADFDHLKDDPQAYLNETVFKAEAAKIKMDRAAAWPLRDGDGDTIWMGAIDGNGMAVSYIQSIFWDWGSGVTLANTGILWQNRAAGFSLDPKSINAIAPGKRPYHTLNPPLAVFNDGRVMSYGTMGGDPQPQIQAQLFTRYLMGQSVAEALAAPRFVWSKALGQNDPTLKIEPEFDSDVATALGQAGHDVETVNNKDGFGHAGMLVKNPKDGAVEAGHDPRADGGALGL